MILFLILLIFLKKHKTMSKLLMLKGLPASGKTTYAKELVARGWKRVNKDELRIMIDDGKWSKKNEELIKLIERDLTGIFLNAGWNVVVDDTNFAYEEFWKKTAEELHVEFEVKFFDISFQDAIDRDAKRGDKSVGAKVIQRMYDQYLKPKKIEFNIKLPSCYIFDIDGTLAQMVDRSPYDYTKIRGDEVNTHIAGLAHLLGSFTNILIVSGRTDDCMNETIKWLNDNEIKYDKIFMRKYGDMRNDSIIKKEIYENNIKDKFNVLSVFDDRNRVVDMWRSLGLTCCQVNYGNF